MKMNTGSSPDKNPFSNPRHNRPKQNAQEKEIPPVKQEGEVSWTWKRQSMQGYSSRIKLSYRKTVLDDIKSVLTVVGGKKLVQQFEDGCFGHLMHFIGGESCNKALHELISHEIKLASAGEHELWFHISGTNIRFSPAEYALVTGFHFGSFTNFDPLGTHEMPPDGVYMRFCSGRPVTLKELWKRFISRDVRGSADDCLKVAHVLALYLMALGYSVCRAVDEWVWVLVEDLDVWNRFPWGAYSYRALMHYVGLLPSARVEGSRSAYSFHGPVWALQIWAYEAIPALGNKAACKTGEDSIPRCLKWSFRGNKHVDLSNFLKHEHVCYVRLEPTDEEQLQQYWLSTQTRQPLGVRYAPPGARRPAIQGKAKAYIVPSDDDTALRQQPGKESCSADPLELSDIDGSLHSSTCNRQKHTHASMRSSGIFNEARFVDRVSSRVVDLLIEPVAERMTERLIEPVVERLMQQPVSQMKQWIEGLMHQQSSQPNKEDPDQSPIAREDCDKGKTKNKCDMGRSPLSKEETRDDERCESSSGDERRRRSIKRGKKKKKSKYHSESSSSESSDSHIHRRRRRNRRRCHPSSTSEGCDSDARGSRHNRRSHRRQQQHHSASYPD